MSQNLDVLDMVARSIMEHNEFKRSDKEKNISVWRSDTFESDDIFHRQRRTPPGKAIELHDQTLSDQTRHEGERKHWRPSLSHSYILERHRRQKHKQKARGGKDPRVDSYAKNAHLSFPQSKNPTRRQHHILSYSEDSDERYSNDPLRAGLVKLRQRPSSMERADTTDLNLTCCKPHFRSLGKRHATFIAQRDLSIVKSTMQGTDSARFRSSMSGMDGSFSTMDLGSDSNSESCGEEYFPESSGRSGELDLLPRLSGKLRHSSAVRPRGKLPREDAVDTLINLAFGIIPAVVVRSEETYDLMVERLKQVATARSYNEHIMKLALLKSLGISPCDGATLRLATPPKAFVPCIPHVGRAERDSPIRLIQENVYYFDISVSFDDLVDHVARAYFEPCYERIKQLERSIMNPSVTFEVRTAVYDFWTKVRLYQRLCRRWQYRSAFTERMLQQCLFRSLPSGIRVRLARMEGWADANHTTWDRYVDAAISHSSSFDSSILPCMEAELWCSGVSNETNSTPKYMALLSSSGSSFLPLRLTDNLQVASYSRVSASVGAAGGRRHHGHTSTSPNEATREGAQAAYMALVSHVASRALARRRQQQQQDYQCESHGCRCTIDKGKSIKRRPHHH